MHVKKMGLSVNADFAPGQTHLRAFNGGITRYLGLVNLWVEVPFYATSDVPGTILGVPELSALAVTIDPANGRLIII